MLQFQILTEKDRRESLSLEIKRRAEEERKARLLNAKSRLIGVDVEALKKQVDERKNNSQSSAEEDMRYLAEQKARSNFILSKERELEIERRRIEIETNEYRKKFQRKEDAREFDINDPNIKKKTKPPRSSDNDDVGLASAQKFLGEDLMALERRQAQKDQMRSWLEQQISERKQNEEARNIALKEYQNVMSAMDARATQLENVEKYTRQQMLEENARFNKAMAAEKECKRMREKAEVEEDNIAEIYNNLTSDMLTENPECAQSNFGPKKKVAQNYRGLTDAEKQKLFSDQRQQVVEHRKQKDQDEYTTKVWDQMSNNFARSSLLAEREKMRRQKAINMEVQEENIRLAREQVERREYLKKVVYTNRASDEFFDQFNRTAR